MAGKGVKKTGWSQVDARLAALKEAGGDDESKTHEMQERGQDYPAAVHTKPATTKTFSDGTVRTWNDSSQAWEKVK